MNRYLNIFSFLLLTPVVLFSQTREETADFIIKEFKSLENKTYFMTEVAFSPTGDTFTLRRRRQNRPDKGLVIPLKHVDIYCRPTHHATGVDSYDLVARSRGRDGLITLNGLAFHGTVNLVGGSQDAWKIRALERAFVHLTALVGGRKELFSPP